jgi:hypothetical protein
LGVLLSAMPCKLHGERTKYFAAYRSMSAQRADLEQFAVIAGFEWNP